MKMNNQGFTLIELMISLAVSGILMGVAIPASLSAIHATRASEAHTALLGSLMTASSKAALHGARTTLCPSHDGQTCLTGFDWSMGWIGFIDQNASREREPNESIIFSQTALQDTRLISSSGRTRIVFQGNGGNAGSNATFTLCDQRGITKAKTLVVSNTGNLRNGVPNATQISLACQFK